MPKFGLLNICSMENKAERVLLTCLDNGVNVACFTETGHKASDACVKKLRLARCKLIEKESEGTSEVGGKSEGSSAVGGKSEGSSAVGGSVGGGLMILGAEGTEIMEIPVPPVSTFEVLCGRVCIGNFSCVMAVVYRKPPLEHLKTFFKEFALLLHALPVSDEAVFVLGNFSLHLENIKCPRAAQLKSVLSNAGLRILKTGPTHHGGATTDLVAARMSVEVPDVQLVGIPYSDHDMVTWTVEMKIAVIGEKWQKFKITHDARQKMNFSSELEAAGFECFVDHVLRRNVPMGQTDAEITRMQKLWGNLNRDDKDVFIRNSPKYMKE